MIWLWVYLVAGVVYLALIYGIHLRERQANKTSLLLKSMRGSLSTKDMLLEKVIAPAIGCTLVVLAWPAAVVYSLQSKRDARLEKKRREDAVFKVRADDLLHRTTQADVEATARIVDPLRAVHDLPFGHLHIVWKSFLDQRPPSAELWTFACDWKNDWGHVSVREGYVWVLGDQRSPWMLTLDVSKDRDDE